MISISENPSQQVEICGTTKPNNMRFFALTFDKVLIRFFLMMACVIGGLFAGQPLIAILALPLFLSAVLGISFLPEAKEQKAASINKMEAKQRQAA